MLKLRNNSRLRPMAGVPPSGWRFILAAGVCVALPAAAAAADAWSVDQVSVAETLEGQAGEVRTQFEKARSGDVRITLDLSDGQHRSKGTVLVVSGKWLLSRDLAPTARPIDYVDAAALNSQLVLALLRAAAPHGPPDPGRDVPVAVSEPTQSIHVSTNTASGDFVAPWNLEGSLSVQAAGAPTEYRLTLHYHTEGRDMTMHLTGSAGSAVVPFELPDDTTLSGWTVQRLSGRRMSGDQSAATVGALRRLP